VFVRLVFRPVFLERRSSSLRSRFVVVVCGEFVVGGGVMVVGGGVSGGVGVGVGIG
jgi:hypothetical protein